MFVLLVSIIRAGRSLTHPGEGERGVDVDLLGSRQLRHLRELLLFEGPAHPLEQAHPRVGFLVFLQDETTIYLGQKRSCSFSRLKVLSTDEGAFLQGATGIYKKVEGRKEGRDVGP